ncbi:MAG: hypothetical protein JW786_12365 [Desulfobacterales bacterium]|nr:hypothetical protein [Desulfobacterales bacterium]
MDIVELTDYMIIPTGKGSGLKNFNLKLSAGDVGAVHTDSPDDAHLLLKALATIEYPASGVYRFMGKQIDFSDYRTFLSCKRKIGYIASDAAMISKKTVRENLLLMRYYFENSLSLTLDDKTVALCKSFNIENKLDLPAVELHLLDLRIAIMIRELTKDPYLLLIERPEDFIKHSKFDLFVQLLKETLRSNPAVAFISYDNNFVEKFSNKKIGIAKDGVALNCA